MSSPTVKLQNPSNIDELIFRLGDNGDGTGGYLYTPPDEVEPIETIESPVEPPKPTLATPSIVETSTSTKPSVLDWVKTLLDGAGNIIRANNGLPPVDTSATGYVPSVPGNSTPTDNYKWALYILVIVVVCVLAYLVFKGKK